MLGPETRGARASSRLKSGCKIVDATGSYPNCKHLLGPSPGSKDAHVEDPDEGCCSRGGEKGEGGRDGERGQGCGSRCGRVRDPTKGENRARSDDASDTFGLSGAITKKFLIDDDEKLVLLDT